MTSLVEAPLVRVVLLDFNGGDLIVEAVRAVTRTEWPPDRLEVFVVDNCSVDGSIERIREEFPNVSIVYNATNRGFPGNNAALEDLDGVDFVALVNSDALVDPGWLRPMVEVAMVDSGVGAVAPKILFADRYLEIPIQLTNSGGIGRESIRLRGVRVDGREVFSRCHVTGGGGRTSDRSGVFEWLTDGCILRVPFEEPSGVSAEGGASVEVVLESQVRCEFPAGRDAIARQLIGGQPTSVTLRVVSQLVDVVNNVGSWLDDHWTGHERGLHEVDDGAFDAPVEVGAWCGAAVLLRAKYLKDVGLFEESFFLYYEDTDLSVRGRGRGWRVVSEPRSIVRHVHSASTVEGSAVAAHFIERNRLLLLLRHARISTVSREFVRFVAVTMSYGRSALAAAIRTRQMPDFTTPSRRLSSLLGAVRGMRTALEGRRAIAGRLLLTRDELERSMALGSDDHTAE